MRTAYDSTTAADIPTTARVVCGYIDGLYAWSEADWQRFPDAVKVQISVDPSHDAGHVQDVEQGNGTPEQAVGWAKLRRASGADPTVYCSWDAWQSVVDAFNAAGEPLPHFWVARWDGIMQIPDGAIAKQYADPQTSGGHFDLSVCVDVWPGVDAAPPAPSPTPAPPPQPPAGKYVVRSGDTLSSIAEHYGMTWQALWDYGNNRREVSNPNLIYPGQVLDVPTAAPTPRKTYTVRAGDTLSSIASDPGKLGDVYHGNWQQLYANNRGTIGGDPNVIYPGQVLH